MKIQIKSIYGNLLFEGDFPSLADCLVAAVKSRANLADAYLAGANLARANLADANLADAYLAGANLADANLAGAYLARADLADAYLARADLAGAYLAGAYLADAYLARADLAGAYLARADLAGAKNADLAIAKTRILPEGELIGWKKLAGGLIAKLKIPNEAKRCHAFGRKCRAEFAMVLEIWDGNKGVKNGISLHDHTFVYEVGNVVKPYTFEQDYTKECSGGIHFYITRIEAENHN